MRIVSRKEPLCRISTPSNSSLSTPNIRGVVTFARSRPVDLDEQRAAALREIAGLASR
jgi:hypothetical protein